MCHLREDILSYAYARIQAQLRSRGSHEVFLQILLYDRLGQSTPAQAASHKRRNAIKGVIRLYESKYAVCPYYHRHESNRICCEGTSENNTLNLVFYDQKKMIAYSKHYCNDIEGCKRCKVHQMLDGKYSDKEGG